MVVWTEWDWKMNKQSVDKERYGSWKIGDYILRLELSCKVLNVTKKVLEVNLKGSCKYYAKTEHQTKQRLET